MLGLLWNHVDKTGHRDHYYLGVTFQYNNFTTNKIFSKWNYEYAQFIENCDADIYVTFSLFI